MITHLLRQGEAHLETVAPDDDGRGVVRFDLRNVSKRMLRRLGHPRGAPSSVVGRAEEVSLSSTAPPRQGVWAATTTIAMVRRMEWRPPLLYVNPCSHRVSATLKISQKCVKQQPKNERAVLCAVRLFPPKEFMAPEGSRRSMGIKSAQFASSTLSSFEGVSKMV